MFTLEINIHHNESADDRDLVAFSRFFFDFYKIYVK